MKNKIVSLFAGAGGLDLGFKKAGFNIIWANEFDKYAVETYKKNFGDHIVQGDISLIDKTTIPKADILIGGFPCQPFSIAGYRKGFEDTRGELFWEIIKTANSAQPEVIVLENVRNLVSHDNGNTFKVIVDTLQKNGYHVKYKVLRSFEYGIPQTRERIFIVCFKDIEKFKKHEWPKHAKRTKKFREMLEADVTERKYFYTDTKYNEMLKEKGDDSVLQLRRHYVRKNAKKMFPTLTANMGTGGHNVPIIFDEKAQEFRKLTPRETFNVQGFPKTFKFPEGMANGRLYKQAGNAVTVNVSHAVAKSIKEVM